MKNRAIRLAIAAGVAALAAGPMTSSAQAFQCPPPVVSTVCWVYGQACQHVPQGQKVDPHELACESFA